MKGCGGNGKFIMVLSYTSQIRKSLLEKHKLVIALIAHLRGTTVTEKKKKILPG